jgi:amino acid adenylation domain-containing protein
MAQASGNVLVSQSPRVTSGDQRDRVEKNSSLHEKQALCVPELVAAHAAAHPQAIAVSQGKLSLTYQELDQRADRLARLLQSRGVGPDVVVAIHLNRSPAAIVAALGVLKAGGAYLPMDPGYPADRVVFMLKDSLAPVLITGHCMLATLPACPEHVVVLDPEGRCDAGQVRPPIAGQTELNHLAYVIYTSGSTGQPKGVEITHAGLLNLVHWHRRAFRVTVADRACQLAALGFDAAVWEVWPYLAAGASIRLPEALPINEPEAVRDWLVSQAISICFLATPLAERIMMLEWPKTAALRVMLTGADTLHHYPPAKLPFQLINNYGPTECTVVASSGTVLPSEHPGHLPTIGRAIDNVQIFILNDQKQEVPHGEPGEIYIGGAGVARGYRNRPALTEERFIPSPRDPRAGARLYKTGDLGCFLPDGQLAFLGRVDEQIKVRGFRIEPGEIVKVLDEHPQIQASAVVARKTAAGDSQLVAYFVAAAKAQPLHTELRNFIAARLPDYMVPATFVKLEGLPLNSSGKVDRVSLPAPSAENTLRDNAFVTPGTLIEERLASILAPLLGLDRVSVEDNFFLLGGHSLLGTQLIAHVRDAFAVDLSLRSLFDAPTVAKLAIQIESLLLARLASMSDADVERMLEAMPPANA